MTDPYVTATALKAAVSIPDGSADADVNRALNAASRAVEQLCQRRTFHKDATVTTRRFTATGSRYVRVDDATAITAVRSDGVTLTADEWIAQPLNAEVDGEPAGWLEAATATGQPFSCLPGAIEVDATYGWPAVPAQVEQFVVIIASKLLKRTREAPFGMVTVGGLDGQAVRLAKSDPDAMLLIEPLIRNHPVGL